MAGIPDFPSVSDEPYTVSGEGRYVAWVALRGAPEGDGRRIRNPAFMALWMGVLDRSLTILGPL